MAAVKDNRDRRDADGDPEDLESAKGVIANQDEDMDILFDIIDTLLAQKEFDEAGCTDPQTDEGDDTTDENNDEGDDDTDNQDSDDDPIPTATPADHTQGEVLNADGIDAIIRQRVKIGMIGKALNLDGVEDMSISAAKKAIIKAVRPEMRLDGKSDAFVNAAFSTPSPMSSPAPRRTSATRRSRCSTATLAPLSATVSAPLIPPARR